MPPAYQCKPLGTRHDMGDAVPPEGGYGRLNLRNRLRALVVDWDDTSRRVLSAVLSNLGVEVQVVENGMEAMKLLESGEASFDIVTVELFMPIMNGREIASRIRRMGLDCMIIGVSAGTIITEILAFLAVADEFMEKPPNLDRFAEILISLDTQRSRGP